MDVTAMFIAAILVSPAVGLVIWARLALGQIEDDLCTFAGIDNVNIGTCYIATGSHWRSAMANLFLKKNPSMSLWLSSANRFAGSMRAQATAQTKRQITTAVTQAATENWKLWCKAVGPALPKAKPKRRR